MKGVGFRFMAICLISFGGGMTALSSKGIAETPWQVSMTTKQANAFEEHKARKGNKAFAISPDGAWGYTFDYSDAKAAQKKAVANCRKYMRKKQRDCVVFSINGKQQVSGTIPVKRVSALYKPLKTKDATAVFGLAPGSFKGDKKTAKAQYRAFEKGQISRDGLPRDAQLEKLLTGRSLMSSNNRPVMLWFSPTRGEHHSAAKSGVLISHFTRWIATPSGLVCKFDARWDNGNPLNDTCLFIDSISNGKVRFAWGHSMGSSRKAHLLQGDARFAAAR